MITKIIHYCWFGGNKKSKLIRKCIKSWKKYCPDYEIKEWNESNFDINCCQYVKEAYDNKKWAFVSDYVRHVVLDEYGGVYLDTDVELLKDPREFFNKPLLAKETNELVATGLIMVCEKHMPYCKFIINEFNNEKFILDNGELNTKTICERTTAYFQEKGLSSENIIENIDGFTIYPQEYFCPYNYYTKEENITDNTVAYHHYLSSWMPASVLRKRKIQKFLGPQLTNIIVRIKRFFRGKNNE